MSGPHTNAAFYAAPVSEFLAASDEEAYAPLAAPAPWMHLEFDIPRLGRRVDAVLVLPECVIPIEFKVGAKKFERLDIEQAWDFRIGKIGTGAISGKNRSRPVLFGTGFAPGSFGSLG